MEAINFLLIGVLVLLVFNMISGHKRGMVREIISFVSLIVLSIFVVLVGNGLQSYLDGKILNVIVVVILLAILSILHHLLGVVFLPAKLISKLPIVKSGDKLLGIVVGILETVLILWTIYTLVMLLDTGALGNWVVQCTSESRILTWFYEHNYLAKLVEQVGAKLNIAL